MRLLDLVSRWRLSLLGGLVLGIVFGSVEGFSILTVPFSREFGISRAEASGMYAVYLLASAIYAPFVGVIIDRFGPRRVIVLTLPCLSLSLALCGRATTLWHMYAIYVVPVALATTLLILSSQVMVNNGYPSADRGSALGISYACVGVGDLIFFTAIGLIVQNSGWRAAYLFLAISVIVCAVLFALADRVVHRAEPHVSRSTNATWSQTSETVSNLPIEQTGHILRIVLTPAFAVLLVAALTASALDFVVFQHLAPFLVTSGYIESTAAFTLGIAAFGYVAGQLGGGILSDRYGRRWVGLSAGLWFAVCLLIVWFVRNVAVTSLVALVIGACVGAIIGTRTAIMGDMFSGPSLGKVSGIVQLASAVGAAFGTWLGGVGFDLTGSYFAMFAVSFCAAGLWASCVTVLTSNSPKNQSNERVHLASPDSG